MSSGNSKFSYGKQYKNALGYAKENGFDMKALKWFSDTGFADNAYRMFHNFFGQSPNSERVSGKTLQLEKRQMWQKIF